MSSGYKVNGIDLDNYFQPYFSGSNLASLSGYKKNGVQAFARRDNNPNNSPTISVTGYKFNGTDIATLVNKVNPSLTIQLSGSTTYNGQAQQANVDKISPTDSWISVTTSTKTNAGTYNQNNYTYTPSSGYVLTVAPSTFTINPSPIDISLNGSSSVIWNGALQTFSNYSVSGTYSQDTGWSVNNISQSAVGTYTAYISISSPNYSLGSTTTLSWSIVPSSAPGAPTIGSSSSGDKSFTANWTAPTVTGGQILGYYVSYSTNGGSTWSSEVTTSSLSYTWSGNQVIFNGNTYIARVRAYNSFGPGSYSGNSVGVVPTFAKPTVVSVSGTPGYPSTGAVGQRPFYVTFSPTACVDYSQTWIAILSPYESFGTYSISINNGLYNTGPYTSSAANQTSPNIFNVYCGNVFSGSTWYSTTYNQTYYIKVITYNNDNYTVESDVYTYTTIGPYYQYLTNAYSDQTGTFNVTGNTFNQTSAYAIPNADTQITSLTVSASTNGTVTIATAARSFVVGFSGATTGTFSQTLSGSQAPWTTNSGTTYRNLAWNVADTGYNVSGCGKIRVTGAGSIGTWNTQQQIRVIVYIYGDSRYLSPY